MSILSRVSVLQAFISSTAGYNSHLPPPELMFPIVDTIRLRPNTLRTITSGSIILESSPDSNSCSSPNTVTGIVIGECFGSGIFRGYRYMSCSENQNYIIYEVKTYDNENCIGMPSISSTVVVSSQCDGGKKYSCSDEKDDWTKYGFNSHTE